MGAPGRFLLEQNLSKGKEKGKGTLRSGIATQTHQWCTECICTHSSVHSAHTQARRRICCRGTKRERWREKEEEEGEGEIKSPHVNCIESQSQHHAVVEIPPSPRCLPSWLSVFAWSQWLLEPPIPTFRRAKSSLVSTSTEPQALEGKAQARKALQTSAESPSQQHLHGDLPTSPD